MSSPTFTVPSTATYYDRFSGVGYKLKAGQVITQRRAWLLQIAGASEPGSGLATIHNWFPDGAVSSAALIDTEADNDYDTHLWAQFGGSESLSFVAAADCSQFRNRFNAVQVDTSGDFFGEGTMVADWTCRYSPEYEPGRYSVGFTVASGLLPLWATVTCYDETVSDLHEYSAQSVVISPNYTQRYTLAVAPSQPCRIVLNIQTVDAIPNDTISLHDLNAPSPATSRLLMVDLTPDTFYVGQLMITDGDAMIFRDGASAGWSWSGTPHASASHGPQP